MRTLWQGSGRRTVCDPSGVETIAHIIFIVCDPAGVRILDMVCPTPEGVTDISP